MLGEVGGLGLPGVGGAPPGLVGAPPKENPNSTHPLEVWTGINFGLAAFLAQSGRAAEGMEITQAVVQQIYRNGLQFRTPEAITANATFRASHYLRAMAIWAIYGVLVPWNDRPTPGHSSESSVQRLTP